MMASPVKQTEEIAVAKIIIELDTADEQDLLRLQGFVFPKMAGALMPKAPPVERDYQSDHAAEAEDGDPQTLAPAPAAMEEKRGRGRPRKAEQPAAPVTPEAPAAAIPPPPPANEAPAPTAPPPPAAVPAAPVTRTMADLSGAITKGRVTLAAVNEQAAANGCADVLGLSASPAALAAVLAYFDSLGAFA